MRKSGTGLRIIVDQKGLDAFCAQALKHIKSNPGRGFMVCALHTKGDDADVIQKTLQEMGEITTPRSVRPRLKLVPKDELRLHLADDATDPGA